METTRVDLPPFFLNTFLFASAAQWLLLRVFSRAAIYAPKSEMTISVFTWLTNIGAFAFNLSILLGGVALAWIAWSRRRTAPALSIAIFFLLASNGIVSISNVGTVWSNLPTVGTAILLALLTGFLGMGNNAHRKRITWALVASAYLLYCLYVLMNYAARGKDLNAPFVAEASLYTGEVLFVIAITVFALAYGRRERWMRQAGLASLAVIVPIVLWFVNSGIVSIVALWSLGLSMFLPAPIYALALGGLVFAILSASGAERTSLILIAVTGYALLDTQSQLVAIAALTLAFLAYEPQARRKVVGHIFSENEQRSSHTI